jgi:hypothetical protein
MLRSFISEALTRQFLRFGSIVSLVVAKLALTPHCLLVLTEVLTQETLQHSSSARSKLSKKATRNEKSPESSCDRLTFEHAFVIMLDSTATNNLVVYPSIRLKYLIYSMHSVLVWRLATKLFLCAKHCEDDRHQSQQYTTIRGMMDGSGAQILTLLSALKVVA